MGNAYDLIVIGAGSGGVRAARMAASYGATVAIIEESRVGGTCVIRGCVPKKLFVFASRFPDLFDVAKSFGWTSQSSFDWATLLANKDREIDRLEGLYVSNLERFGVTLIRDRGVVEGPTSVKLINADEILTAKRILIATGGHPFKPDIVGAELGITSNEAFHLPELPKRILIEGAGYIAVEFAGIFAGLGVDVTVSYRGTEILRRFDNDIRSDLEQAMRDRGIKFLFDRRIERLAHAANGIDARFTTGDSAQFDLVMFATGRLPNISGLGLESASVELKGSGHIIVDEHAQTSVTTIFAVGDVVGHAELTPVAIRQGAAFAETFYNATPTTIDLSLVPTAVFSEPEIGTIGLTEQAAVAQHQDIDVYLSRFRPMMDTLSARTGRMMLKLITEANGGRVLGCHLFGPGAAEMIQLIAIPMSMAATKADFDRAIAVHPTAAEELVTFKAPSYSYADGAKTKVE